MAEDGKNLSLPVIVIQKDLIRRLSLRMFSSELKGFLLEVKGLNVL